nr:hypothetical protein [uncultured Methanolobus sp.]
MASNRFEFRPEDGDIDNITRISSAKGCNGTNAVRLALHFYVDHLVEIGELAPNHKQEPVDVGYEFLEKIFGMRFRHVTED